VRFVVDKVALGQAFIWVLLFNPVNVIPPLLHTHLYLNVALTRRTRGRILGTVNYRNSVPAVVSVGEKSALMNFRRLKRQLVPFSPWQLMYTSIHWSRICTILHFLILDRLISSIGKNTGCSAFCFKWCVINFSVISYHLRFISRALRVTLGTQARLDS
jgi:hypothetical protein